MENVLCRSDVELIESQGIWYTIAIILLGVSDCGDDAAMLRQGSNIAGGG